MQHLTEVQAAEYLDGANIHSTTDVGYAKIYIGTKDVFSFVMLEDTQGLTVVTEGL